VVAQAGHPLSVARVVHVVLVVGVVVGKVMAGVGQRPYILDEESYRNGLLQAAEDRLVEDSFVAHRSQDQESDQAAAGDDVCRYQDDHTDLQLAEEHRERLACLQERHQLAHHFESHMPMLRVHQSAQSAALPRLQQRSKSQCVQHLRRRG
jgi:hypothetical protein